jgi:peptide/nickel transport system permease protein
MNEIPSQPIPPPTLPARTARRSQLATEMKRLTRHKPAMVGLAITLVVILVAIFASFIAPYPYAEQNLEVMSAPPSAQHLFGTDPLGRDLFSRVVYGSRIAIMVGLVAVTIEGGIGIMLGLLAGYFGGKVDTFVSGLTDTLWAFPPMVLALGIVTVIGPGLFNVIIAISLVSWAPFSRITRAKVLSVKESEYVEAGRAIGESDFSLLTRYILPNILAPNLILATLTMPSALLTASSLSFLGFGAQPPTPDWGAILSDGRDYLRAAPWISTFPGMAILFTVVGFNFLGDGLRDAFDPRLKL